MASYRIGPSGVFTSDDLIADAKTLDGQLEALGDNDLTTVSEQYFDGYQRFYSEWKTFYHGLTDYTVFGPAWNDSNRDQLIQFEDRLEALKSNYKKESGNEANIPDGGVKPNVDGPKDGFLDFLGIKKFFTQYKWPIIGAVVLLLLILFREPIAALIKGATRK